VAAVELLPPGDPGGAGLASATPSVITIAVADVIAAHATNGRIKRTLFTETHLQLLV
jgi:hypothetical protein